MTLSRTPTPITVSQITGCVLAGGRGARMGGVDKGLQPFLGQSLAAHALQRLAPQVGQLMVNANRHLPSYKQIAAPWDAPVWPDALTDFPGPLAGFLSALSHCTTPWLVCVPCDTPLFPPDLVERMLAAAAAPGQADEVDIVTVHGWEPSAPGEQALWRAQPVFCLLHTRLVQSLSDFLASGARKIDRWTALHPSAQVHFDQAQDHPQAFANANTLAELAALEALALSAAQPQAAQ